MSADRPAAKRQELIATVRRGLSLECDGCTFDDEGRFVTLSSTCTLHGQSEAALSALDALLQERDALAREAGRWERAWHRAQQQIEEHARGGREARSSRRCATRATDGGAIDAAERAFGRPLTRVEQEKVVGAANELHDLIRTEREEHGLG